MEDKRREGECVWVLGTRGTSALQHSFCVCVCVCVREREREREREGEGEGE